MNAVTEVVEVLRNGGVAAIPTDTVYGLAAHGLDAAAVARVFEVKGRPTGMALPLLLADSTDLSRCCVDVPDSALSLADAFWPGSLTLVLRRSDAVPDAVTAGGDTVAVRVPDHPCPGRSRGDWVRPSRARAPIAQGSHPQRRPPKFGTRSATASTTCWTAAQFIQECRRRSWTSQGLSRSSCAFRSGCPGRHIGGVG